MKKVQRSFVIEYKAGRRKPDPEKNSIWGTMDLKSVARDVEDQTKPFVEDKQPDGRPSANVFSSNADPVTPLLIPLTGQPTTLAATEETIMADETETMANTDATGIVEAMIAPKKLRGPRAKSAVLEAGAVNATAEPAADAPGIPEKQKRGRKAKTIHGVDAAKRGPVKRAPKTLESTPVAPAEPAEPSAFTAAGDEMADLLQLEEENQRLRKLLAEKLRAENVDLRKRLKLD